MTAIAKDDTEPRFLCDVMLARLGRWLRAAGYDTEIAGGMETDRALLDKARREGRVLLTHDRKVMEMRHAPDHVVLLSGNGVDRAVAALNGAMAINWLLRPFSRCLLCNTPLEPVPDDQCAHLPPDMRTRDDVRHCPACDKLYWPGSHQKRMRKRLEGWTAMTQSPKVYPEQRS
jgi:uncharacterized protein with PIN domain